MIINNNNLKAKSIDNDPTYYYWWSKLISVQIDPEAPFSGAFIVRSDGWKWVSNIIGVGASFGILTSLLVAMLGQARYMCVIGRSRVIPMWFAKVHPKTFTPVNASIFLGKLPTIIWFRFSISLYVLSLLCLTFV